MASTAVSSPMVPDTMMKGTSSLLSFTMPRAKRPLSFGIDQSEMTTSQGPAASSRRKDSASSTRVNSNASPALRSSRMSSLASVGESSTRSTRSVTTVLAAGPAR